MVAAHSLDSLLGKHISVIGGKVGALSDLAPRRKECAPLPLPLFIDLDRDNNCYRLAMAFHDIRVTFCRDILQQLAELAAGFKGRNRSFHEIQYSPEIALSTYIASSYYGVDLVS